MAAGSAHATPAAHPAEPPLVTAGRAARDHREVAWVRGALDPSGLTGWTAIYDRDTEVPLRLWGPGQPAPGTVADPAAAEAWARAFVAAHIDVLAPGATAGDFVVVANQLDPRGELRSVGLAQYANGIAVLGGGVSFAFKRDRMIMAGSTALPHVQAQLSGARTAARLPASRVASAATAWLGTAGYRVAVRSGPAAPQIIVPIVGPHRPGGPEIAYTIAEQADVATTEGEPGRWNVFVSAATGAAIARQSTLMFGAGTVMFDVSDRGPAADAGRHPQPAPNASHTVDGAPVTSGLDGSVTWTGSAQATVIPGLSGPLVAITNQAGPLVSDTLALGDGGSVTWSRASDPAADAQLDAFVYASQAKRFVKLRIDPALGYLDQRLSVFVNETSGTCNAYSTGDDLHFFPQSPGMCENTGRLADVVYHEFGHSIHRHSIIVGVGQFDSAMSEGVGDTLAVAMTGDPGIGRGFYLNNDPLRDVNPAQKKRWPTDLVGEVHQDGEIYGEAMWDLRTLLQANLGDAAGFEKFLEIYYGTVQRAVDMPSSFAEALVSDDDDGDLSNGTPDQCTIEAAFTAHGLYDPVATGELPHPTRDGFTLSIAPPAPVSLSCGSPTVQSAQVTWRPRGGTLVTIPMIADGAALRATIPTQPTGSVVEYSVTVTLADGSARAFPDNRADPYAQFYVGEATKIWCATFEDGAPDWTHSATPAQLDRWQVGPPHGLGGDPASAFDGNNVLGIALDGDGTYPALTTTAAVSPIIALHGVTAVHLQYERWLGVEDAIYDQATIKANDAVVWHNETDSVAPVAAVAALTGTAFNLIDREWRFQDIDLSTQATRGSIQLAFGLVSDPGFQAAGWNVDDVCLVSAGPVCGNGTVEPTETCDDGNTLDGDGCSATCQDESAGAGCCSAGGEPTAPLALAAGVLGALIAPRRRRSA